MNNLLKILSCSLILLSQTVAANDWSEYYQIEKIKINKTTDPQIGGLVALSNGNIAAAFHDGTVQIYNTKNKKWHIFAKGLHEPLGLIEESPNTLVVMQTPELTRLVDENNDGEADFYQSLFNDFGLSGNYHEFAFGPAVDKAGNYYISLNVASNFAGIYEHIRGEYSDLCPPQQFMQDWKNNANWSKDKNKAGRMFSCVAYRGWVLKVSPEGEMTPFASGFRSPNGLFVDSKDQLWVTDNQGDWIPTSPLMLVKQDNFYGHPASLHWKKDWKKPAVDLTEKDLTPLKTPAAALMPHAELANSPTQPIETISSELFGLPEGELLIGDMNQAQLIRFLPDNVDGTVQGTLIPFLQTADLGIGNNRMTFGKDGTLWVGKTHLGWAGDEGIIKIKRSNKTMFLVNKVEQSSDGFLIHFNQALKSAPTVQISHHGYYYHSKYGSEKVDLTPDKIVNQTLLNNNKTLKITLNGKSTEKLYTIALDNAVSTSDSTLMGNVLRYYLVQKK